MKQRKSLALYGGRTAPSPPPHSRSSVLWHVQAGQRTRAARLPTSQRGVPLAVRGLVSQRVNHQDARG
jgi:hypothetical protein